MNIVHPIKREAILKINNTTTIICQLTVTKSSLIIKNIDKNRTLGTALNLEISFTTMEYSISWVLLDHLISEMILTCQDRLYQFFTIDNSLSKLKPFLDGQIPYRNFSSLYKADELIYQMKGGRVMKVINKLTNQVEVAKQIYCGPDYGSDYKKLIYQEICVAKYFTQFPHQNLLQLKAIFIELDFVVLIFEHLQITSLYRLVERFPGGLPFETLRIIMKTTLKAIGHMHKHKIMHRDIKMDNILMRDIKDLKSIVIIDYGLASSVHSDNQLISKCGTHGYIAPEILKDEKYNELCDIYSVAQVFRTLLNGNSYDTQRTQDTLPLLLLDLLLQMNQDQQFRPSAQECLDHDFFSQSKLDNKYILNIFDRMKRLSEINLKNPFTN